MEKETKFNKLSKIPATPWLLAQPISWSKLEDKPITFKDYIATKYPDLAISLAIPPSPYPEKIRDFLRLKKWEKIKLLRTIGAHAINLEAQAIKTGQNHCKYLKGLVVHQRLRRPDGPDLINYKLNQPED